MKAKFNGIDYDVKPTGKTVTSKSGKSGSDLNGYRTDGSSSRKQLGMYNPETGNKDYTLSGNSVHKGAGKRVGSVKIRK